MTEMSSSVGEILRGAGVSKRKLANCTTETRLYHDLGIYGDVAEDLIEDMIQKHHVDMNGFHFDEFFPPEFPGRNILTRTFLQLVPHSLAIDHRNYRPFTLGRLDETLHTRRWAAWQ